MQKFYVLHDDKDNYIIANESHVTPYGDLLFYTENKLVAGFPRDSWQFFKLAEDEN